MQEKFRKISVTLSPCPDCGRPVSKRAMKCPHCGHVYGNRVATEVWVRIIIYCLIVPIVTGILLALLSGTVRCR